MSERVEYRVRCKVTRDWKLVTDDGTPRGFASEAAAKRAARFLSKWKIVRVTIRRVGTPHVELDELRAIAVAAASVVDVYGDAGWSHRMKLGNLLNARRLRLAP